MIKQIPAKPASQSEYDYPAGTRLFVETGGYTLEVEALEPVDCDGSFRVYDLEECEELTIHGWLADDIHPLAAAA